MSIPNIKFLEKKGQLFDEIINIVTKAIEINALCNRAFSDKKFDELERGELIASNYKKDLLELDNKIVTTIALHHPEASDLRELISYLKMGYELEKIISGLIKFSKKY